MSPERPRIGGELRFRVTSSDDPSSFESGSDLLRMDGLPWSRPLYALQKYYHPLYRKLREEGFVPDDLDRVLLTLPFTKFKYSQSQTLYTLNDSFVVDFSNRYWTGILITEQGLKRIQKRDMFVDYREMYKYFPYTGAYTNLYLSILLY